MRRLHLVSLAAVWLLMMAVVACAGAPTPAAPTSPPTSAPSPTQSESISDETEDLEKPYEDFDPDNFDDPTTIDNEWLPMRPGMQHIFEGVTEEAGLTIPHRVIFTVTDLTKVIDGVRTVVIWDQDFSAGALVETELAFFAQDNDGNVWRMGEYPEVYEDGKLVEAPAWISGLKGAVAGIMMKADPQLGMPSHSQGWAPSVDFTDRGQVDQVGQETCVPAGCYEDVLVVAEFSEAEPDAFQLKYYAEDLGNIRVGWRGADATKETLELVEIIQLSPEELVEIRAQALELEERAYEISEEVYDQTPPIEIPQDSASVPEPTQGTVTDGATAEVVVYASDLPESALSEFEVWDEPVSPGGKMLGVTNNGDEMDPPPEDDPHVTFNVQVQDSIPYRCWIHMKVGAPKGKSQANVFFVQFSDAMKQSNEDAFAPETDSYLTAQGPTQEGWTWVGCDLDGSDSLIYFKTSGEITVRLQAGMEGVGFDQFLLSSARFLDEPPSDAVVEQ